MKFSSYKLTILKIIHSLGSFYSTFPYWGKQ